ncbi:MAG: hypothetical protein DMF59_19115 [Acidobacteria bacterium]|nr:MAG: hypothetical protein DMF59_19115 [Acidobacteriota bacterium]
MARDSTNQRGTMVAAGLGMARRITAVIGMVALIGLLIVLVWRVYLHHERGAPADEPTVVSNIYRSA